MVYIMVYTIWYIPYGIYQLLHGIYHPKVVYTMGQPSRCQSLSPAAAARVCPARLGGLARTLAAFATPMQFVD
jgi:hypothetical protein